MLTHFNHEEWQKFREDCDFYAWQAEELANACEKAMAIIARRCKNEKRSIAREALMKLQNDFAAQIADLQAMQNQLELCDRETPLEAGQRNIGLAACAIRKLTMWPQSTKTHPMEYSNENAPDNIGVWRIQFSRD
jgi:hypothetical protein